MQNSTRNENLFNRFLKVKDNRKFIIDSILLIINPCSIIKYINQILMIESKEQVFLAKSIILLKILTMDNLNAHEMKVFHCTRS